jgi:hypothetical protein
LLLFVLLFEFVELLLLKLLLNFLQSLSSDGVTSHSPLSDDMDVVSVVVPVVAPVIEFIVASRADITRNE